MCIAHGNDDVAILALKGLNLFLKENSFCFLLFPSNKHKVPWNDPEQEFSDYLLYGKLNDRESGDNLTFL